MMDIKKCMILRERKDDYFLKYLEFDNIYNIYKEKGITNKLRFKIVKKLFTGGLQRFWDIWKDNLDKFDTVIIFDSCYVPEISGYIKRCRPDIKIIMYFWNVIPEANRYILFDKNIDEFWTFDKGDAKKYRIRINPQFYSNEVRLEKNDVNYDLLFVGRPKDRMQKIQELRDYSTSIGLKVNFVIVEDEKDFVQYDEYLKMVSSARAIVDISNDGQSGLSLRCMEGLFLKKKVVTDNIDVKNYDFYKKNNFFVLGENKLADIKGFINGGMDVVPGNVVKKYSFEAWLDRMLKGQE